MSLRGRLPLLVALTVSVGALGAPTGCTSFGGDDTPADAADAGDVTTAEAGKEDDCRPACTTGSCASDSFEGLDPPWSRQASSNNTASVANGFFVSILAESGAAFLSRPIRVQKGAALQLSFVVIVENLPANGTTLAKVVDGEGNEANVRVDDGKLNACIERAGAPLPNNCTPPARKLVVGESIRITFAMTLPNSARTGGVTLRTNCEPPLELPLPGVGLFQTNLEATLHLGLEGPGAGRARFDSADVSPPN